jgi:hypothetical protein
MCTVVSPSSLIKQTFEKDSELTTQQIDLVITPCSLYFHNKELNATMPMWPILQKDLSISTQ